MRNFLTPRSEGSSIFSLVSSDMGHQAYDLGKTNSPFICGVISLFMERAPSQKHRILNEMMLRNFKGATTLERLKFMEEEVAPKCSEAFQREMESALENAAARLIRTDPFTEEGEEIVGVEIVGNYSVKTGELIATIIDDWVDTACKKTSTPYVIGGKPKEAVLDRRLDAMGFSEEALVIRRMVKDLVDHIVDNYNPSVFTEQNTFMGMTRLGMGLQLMRRGENFERLEALLTEEELNAFKVLENSLNNGSLAKRSFDQSQEMAEAEQQEEQEVAPTEAPVPDALAPATATVTAEVQEIEVTTHEAPVTPVVTTNYIAVFSVALMTGNKLQAGDVEALQAFINQGGAKLDKVAGLLSPYTARKLTADDLRVFVGQGEAIQPKDYEQTFNDFFVALPKSTQNELRKRKDELLSALSMANFAGNHIDMDARITREPVSA